MLTTRELAIVIHATLLVARLQAAGLALFDASLSGFWRSFWAAAFLAPIYLIALMLGATSFETAGEGLRYVLLQAIAYVVVWVAFPLLMVRVAEGLGRGHNYFRYIVAYNWFRLIEAAALTVLLLAGALDPGAGQLVALLLLATMLLYDWFIARAALEIDGTSAAGVVVMAFLLGLVVRGLAERMV